LLWLAGAQMKVHFGGMGEKQGWFGAAEFTRDAVELTRDG
jgi:hypothetical protein